MKSLAVLLALGMPVAGFAAAQDAPDRQVPKDPITATRLAPAKGARFIAALRAGKKVTLVTRGTSLTGLWPGVLVNDWLNQEWPGQVTLCNEGMGASASRHLGFSGTELKFSSRSGPLRVFREGKRYVLDFPADDFDPAEMPDGMLEALGGKEPMFCYLGKTDYMLIYEKQSDIENIKPDFVKLGKVKARGIIVSAPGEWVDVVSRFFGPQVGINEDPVTGSAHTTLVPYWSRQLAKTELTARQLSERGGDLFCKNKGSRVEIGGEAVTFFEGNLFI